jgi:hypothetical protein
MKLYSSNLKRDLYKEKISGGRFGHNEAVQIPIRRLLMNSNSVRMYRDPGVENFKRFKILNTTIGLHSIARKYSMCISSTHI